MADKTEGTAMVAIQGPKVIERLSERAADRSEGDRSDITSSRDSFMLIKFTVFRSGYTGEDGVEMILPAKMAGMAMKMLGRQDRTSRTRRSSPAGPGRARHAAAGSGHAAVWPRAERDDRSDLGGAGLGGGSDKDFIGVEKLREIEGDGPDAEARRPGTGRQAHRPAGDAGRRRTAKVVGEVTSGTFSPTLQKSIAMAYVDANLAAEGTQLAGRPEGRR